MDIVSVLTTAVSISATFAVTILGIYLKSISSRQSSLESSFRAIERDFVKQVDFNRDIARIEANVGTIHTRLDRVIEIINNNQQQMLTLLNDLTKGE